MRQKLLYVGGMVIEIFEITQSCAISYVCMIAWGLIQFLALGPVNSGLVYVLSRPVKSQPSDSSI